MVLGAVTAFFLGAGEADDGGECLAGTRDNRLRGGDGDVRPGDIFCRLLEGTGEADLLVPIRLGGMFLNGLLSLSLWSQNFREFTQPIIWIYVI